MARFYTRRNQVPLAPGQTLGFRKGKGYFAKGKALPYPGYLSEQQQLARARQFAETALAPTLAMLEEQQAEAERQTQQRSRDTQGYAQASAAMLAPIGPQVQQGYADAGQRTANFSKGYSVGMQMVQQQAANESNRLLAQNNAPAGQMQQVTADAADVLYGTTGVIPATSLEREGAAFGSAAAQLPATAIERGRISLQDLHRQAEEGDREFAAALREVEAKRPGIVQEALADLRQQQGQARALDLNERIAAEELGLDRQNQAFNQAARTESLAQGRDRVAIQRQNAAERRLQNDRQWQRDIAKLDLEEGRLSVARAREARLRSGGFKPAERRKLRKDAAELVELFYYGKPAEQRFNSRTQEWEDVPNTRVKELTYWDALKRLISRGIPYTIARNTLDRYYRPGEGGRPQYTRAELRRNQQRLGNRPT
jgi:hypothetical protein